MSKKMLSTKAMSAPEYYCSRAEGEHLHKYRSQFQRDRDRILYSKSLRRLNGKTQVFLPSSHDHVRNRLTHTLEVAQIARVTSRQLCLNEDLSEAIALGHDIGHTPFGHIGERALNLIMNNCDVKEMGDVLCREEYGFKHNWQAIRIACDINRIYPGAQGMNLTNFTLWGILNHSKLGWTACSHFKENRCFLHLDEKECDHSGVLNVHYYDKYLQFLKAKSGVCDAWSFEGYVVNLSDEIAQRHHDIEDAYFMNVLSSDDIIEKIKDCFFEIFTREDRRNFNNAKKNKSYFVPFVAKLIVNFYNKNLIETSANNFKKFMAQYDIRGRRNIKDIYPDVDDTVHSRLVSFSSELQEADGKFKDFLKNSILNSFWVQRMDGKGFYVIRKLFEAYLTNPNQLHDNTILSAYNMYEDNYSRDIKTISKTDLGSMRNAVGSPSIRMNEKFQKALLRAICDHVAGMTDSYVLSEFSRLYGTNPLD